MNRATLPVLILGLVATGTLDAQTREEKVRADRKAFEAEAYWIYNDLGEGLSQARASKKPLLVVLRCIPCEECVKLDDDLVNESPRLRPLLDEFVRVRLISTNGLDLSLFQFDYDQSFAAFILNADGTIYGRYGTRSHRTEWSDDVSIAGLAKALEGALALHKEYPANKSALEGKRGPRPLVSTPEQFASLKGQYTSSLDYEGQVVKSCIHCHQIGDAERMTFRQQNQGIPEKIVFPYPHPKSLGLILDPRESAVVLKVESATPAEAAGFKPGDVIRSMAGQPLLSIADVQWVLHRSPAEGGKVTAEVDRQGRSVEIVLTLKEGWRREDDISWRSSSWGLRRMGTGGMVLEAASDEERKKAGLGEGEMALRVKHVGQYGPHAAAKNAGFLAGDVLVAFDGRTDLFREADLLAYAVESRRPGETVAVTLLREGKRKVLQLPMQE
jgi:hypothetical protein